MIRKFKPSDTEQVMKLWLTGNEDAHFFVPEKYWLSHYSEVREALLKANVFVYEATGKIRGFIGMQDGYIAGIFVDKTFRSHGIGMQLLNYVKQKYNSLTLEVYQKNMGAIAFYHREGFSILSEEIDEDTGEKEYVMVWNKEF